MKSSLLLAGVILFVVFTAAFLTGRFEIAILGAAGAIGALAVGAGRRAQAARPDTDLDVLSLNGRAKVAPLRKLRQEIDTIFTKNPGSFALRAVESMAREEVQRLMQASIQMVQAQEKLSRISGEHSGAQKEMADLEKSIQQATTESEKAMLQSALEARKAELGHYQDLEVQKEKLEAGLRQAEAVLSELKARLAVSAAQESNTSDSDTELRDALTRVRSLTSSLDEAEAILKGNA